MKENIPIQILEFAKYIAPNLVPNKRASGWKELSTETRGNGDLMDLLGSLIVLNKLMQANKVCRMDITCGTGDKSDIEIRVNNKFKKINVKTSSYAPFRDGLNLYVKQEEEDKPIDAYVQVFIHLSEEDMEPHAHIAGWVPTNSKVWQEARLNPIKIPRTNGHTGIKVAVESLGAIEKMIEMADEKF